MPRINLLPVRAAKRAGNARREILFFSLGIMTSAAVSFWLWWHTSQAITEFENSITELKATITSLDKDVERVKECKKKIDVIEQKLSVIEGLRNLKGGPIRLMDDLATILTKQPKVWLTSVVEKEGRLTLEGGAMEAENISEFQIALGKESEFFRDVILSYVDSGKQGDMNFLKWALSCTMSVPSG